MFSIALLSILIMKVVSISAQSMRLQDASLGSVVQIGSFNYVKIAENKYMQSTQVACPDSATVGGMYVKCFKDKSAYESTCSGSGSCNCEYTSIGDVDTTGGTGYDVYTYDCDIPCYTPNATYDSALAKCVCNESGYSYVHTRSSTGTGFACVNASIAYADYYSGMDFDYTGDVQTFTAPVDGTYKLEVWGAQGGTANNIGGYGGYSYGNIPLSSNDIIYVVVGGIGSSSTGNKSNVAGGYNGGGIGVCVTDTNWWCAGGGGATHFATMNGLLSTLSSDKDSVKIVAGGGGGGMRYTGGGVHGGGNGGYGGGSIGGAGQGNGINKGNGGNQESGGSANGGATAGSFGRGGNGGSGNPGGGGGAGYYGGSGGSTGAGGGGSGYIGGVTSGATIAGDQSFPSPSGDTETGHTSNGYARITLISVD